MTIFYEDIFFKIFSGNGYVIEAIVLGKSRHQIVEGQKKVGFIQIYTNSWHRFIFKKVLCCLKSELICYFFVSIALIA